MYNWPFWWICPTGQLQPWDNGISRVSGDLGPGWRILVQAREMLSKGTYSVNALVDAAVAALWMLCVPAPLHNGRCGGAAAQPRCERVAQLVVGLSIFSVFARRQMLRLASVSFEPSSQVLCPFGPNSWRRPSCSLAINARWMTLREILQRCHLTRPLAWHYHTNWTCVSFVSMSGFICFLWCKPSRALLLNPSRPVLCSPASTGIVFGGIYWFLTITALWTVVSHGHIDNTSQPNMTQASYFLTNGSSLEDCHTNFFALVYIISILLLFLLTIFLGWFVWHQMAPVYLWQTLQWPLWGSDTALVLQVYQRRSPVRLAKNPQQYSWSA